MTGARRRSASGLERFSNTLLLAASERRVWARGVGASRRSAPLQFVVAYALAAKFQDRWGDCRDSRFDPSPRVVIDAVAFEQGVELHKRAFRAAVEVFGFRIRLAGANGVAGDLTGAGECLLKHRVGFSPIE
jgi:hypothetical protein